MIVVNPINHLKTQPNPRLVEYNSSASQRIGGQVQRKIEHPHSRHAPVQKITGVSMDHVRTSQTSQYEMDDKNLAARAVTRMTNDKFSSTSGYAGAANDITIQQRTNVTGTRVKWGLLAAGAIITGRTLGVM